MNINIITGSNVEESSDLLILFDASHLSAFNYDWQVKEDIEPTFSYDIVSKSTNNNLPLALLVHLGYYSKEPEAMRIGSAVGDVLKFAKQRSAKRVSVYFGSIDIPRYKRILEAMLISSYSFQHFRQKPSEFFSNLSVDIHVPEADFETAQSLTKRAQHVNAGIEIARDLANHPPAKVTPEYLARSLVVIAEKHGYTCELLDESSLQDEGFIGHIAVGGGSTNKPFMSVAHYKPPIVDPAKPKLALVGKGITFDSGGIDIKPFQDMWLMKADMSGAAAVVGTFEVICALKPDVEVTAIVCCAENMPDGGAYRPSDLLTYKNGKTVEVISTDAEGRLVLADGLIRAGEEGATHIVDIATLTGACVIALGHDYTGLFGNDEALLNAIKSASEETGELVWHMPLPDWYREKYMKSEFCDFKNVGSGVGGSIIAANFLSEFVTDGTSWCHLDIAPTFYHDTSKREYLQAGATGVGVRLMLELAMSLSNL